ncbi:MAG: response regulator, partial [Anaerolineae bacterium]
MAEERVWVLLLDDEEILRVPLKDFLEKNFGYGVDAVASGEEALEQVEKAQGRYDVALIDEVLLHGPDGIEVMQQIKARYPNIECIIFTGWGTESRQRALRAGAFRYLERPFDNDELAMLIRTAAQQVRFREIGQAILAERDLNRVLEGIASAACSLARADEATIVLLEQEKIKIHAMTHPGEPRFKKHFENQELSKDIIQSGQMVRVSDTEQDDRVDEGVRQAGIRSFLGLPIPGEGGNLGVLYVYSQQPGRFDEGSTVA